MRLAVLLIEVAHRTGIRVPATNAVSVPLDRVVLLWIAFGSLDFLKGQLQAKYGATLLIGLPLVLCLRCLVPQDKRNIVAAQA
jgi:hypothetical protein